MRFLVLALLLMPLMEIWLFVQVGGYVGAGTTLLLVLLTAILGVGLMRWQGIGTLARARSRLANSEVPAGEIGEVVLLGMAGFLLVVPGFFTDGLGFLLLFPPLRRAILRRFVQPRILSYRVDSFSQGEVIEGEFYRTREKDRLNP